MKNMEEPRIERTKFDRAMTFTLIFLSGCIAIMVVYIVLKTLFEYI